jgi:hypothetical protein
MSNAKQRLSEIEAQEKVFAEEKKQLLKETKKSDLELVRKLCKQHGFTATNLRDCLVTRGKGDKEEKAVKVVKAKKPSAKQ